MSEDRQSLIPSSRRLRVHVRLRLLWRLAVDTMLSLLMDEARIKRQAEIGHKSILTSKGHRY